MTLPYYFSPCEFFTSLLVVDSLTGVLVTTNYFRSPELSTVFSPILTMVWMVSILPQISNSSSLLSKPLETVPSTLTIIGITITLIHHSSFSFSSKVLVFVYLLDLFYFSLCDPSEQQNSLCGQSFFFLGAKSFFFFVRGPFFLVPSHIFCWCQVFFFFFW